MNRILSITIAIIVLILAVEAGYYWGIKTAPQSQTLTKQIVSSGNTSNSVAQPTAIPTPDKSTKIIVNQKNLEMSKFIKDGAQKLSSGELKTVTEDLVNASNLKSEISRLNYKSVSGVEYIALLSIPKIINFPNDDKFKAEFSAELKQFNFNSIIDISNNDLAKIFYRLGLIAYQNNQKDLVAPLWITMVNLAPEWSYFQLELANYYLSINDLKNAKISIDYCTQFEFPETACSSFLINEIQNNQPQPVGFMKDKIQTEILNKKN